MDLGKDGKDADDHATRVYRHVLDGISCGWWPGFFGGTKIEIEVEAREEEEAVTRRFLSRFVFVSR